MEEKDTQDVTEAGATEEAVKAEETSQAAETAQAETAVKAEEKAPAQETPAKEIKPAAEATKKEKKINRYSVSDLDKKIKAMEEEQHTQSVYYKHLLDRKNELTSPKAAQA